MSLNGSWKWFAGLLIPLVLIGLVACNQSGNTALAGGAEPNGTEPAAQDKGDAAKDEGDKGDTKDGKKKADEPKEEADDNPFLRRLPIPDFPKDAVWINSAPLKKRDLKGKFVILDFWTYCCINCIHILPELKKLEKKYPNQLVVIGVHSAKFETEKETKNIKEAVLRYEIEHPVINDANHRIWRTFGVSSWPTVLMIDPEGFAVWGRAGEITFEQVDEILKVGVDYYRKKNLLDEQPIRFELLSHNQKETPLRFPGKVLADEASKRLYITDSNHNRIVITDLDGKLIDIIGTGAMGRDDGDYAKATFDHPQGVALHGNTLYVADTENHSIRKVDLKAKKVTTISGTGKQGRSPFPGFSFDAPPTDNKSWKVKAAGAELNSPWALLVNKDHLYIAMAGPHQIWRMKLDESEIGPYAGNGREDIVDGNLLPKTPYGTTGDDDRPVSSFAQPSGLTSDGKWLFVADSEGSSIRAVPFDEKEKVRTVVGTAHLPFGRLFEFGDIDGKAGDARLQHALGVVFHDGTIYVADTYNNKIKTVHVKSGNTKTLIGSGKPGYSDKDGLFDEPAGISYAAGKLYIADTNNHKIRVYQLADKKLTTLKVDGLKPPQIAKKQGPPSFAEATKVEVKPVTLKPADGKIQLNVRLNLPEGWKINDLAPLTYHVLANKDSGVVAKESIASVDVAKPAAKFSVPVKVSGDGKAEVQVGLNYFYCQKDGTGLCKMGSVLFTVPVSVAGDGQSSASLIHTVKK